MSLNFLDPIRLSSPLCGGKTLRRSGSALSTLVLLTATALVLILASCSEKSSSGNQIPVSSYDLTIVYSRDLDSNLAADFNKRNVDDLIPRVERFQSSREFPGAFPGVKLLSARFQRPPAENLDIFYDESADRFYSIFGKYFATAIGELSAGRFESGITERQAFEIAALAVYLKYSPRMLVCRKADLFLESRLREHINQTYAQKSGESPKELSTEWWVWSAFPTANEDYRRLLARYRDEIEKSPFIDEIPDGVIDLPAVKKEGLYYEVSMCGLPPGNAREIVRYRTRVAYDGRLHEIEEEVVLTY